MLRWAVVPALAFVVAFGVSLAHFASDDDGGSRRSAAAAPAGGEGRLVVTYTPTVDDADHGYLGSLRLDGADLRNVLEPPDSGFSVNGSPSVSPTEAWRPSSAPSRSRSSPGCPSYTSYRSTYRSRSGA